MFRRALVLFFVLYTQASAATYYVDKSHPSAADTNAGTEALPWLTISKAIATATLPGDTVIVKSGNYTAGSPLLMNITASGTASQPIVFRAQPRRTVTTYGWQMTGNFLEINGFKVVQSAPDAHHGIFTVGDNNRIVDNEIIGVIGSNAVRAIGSDWSTNAALRANHIYVGYNRLYMCQSGIYAQGDNWLVEENEVERPVQWSGSLTTDADYARFFGESNIFRYNYFHGAIASDHITSHVDCFQTFQNNFRWTANNLIEHNICVNFMQFVIIEGRQQPLTKNALIRFNTFDANFFQVPGEGASLGLSLIDSPHTIVVHNTMFDLYSTGIRFDDDYGNLTKHGRAFNNLFVNVGRTEPGEGTGVAYLWRDRTSGDPTLHEGDNNLIYLTKPPFREAPGMPTGKNSVPHGPNDLIANFQQSDLVGIVANPAGMVTHLQNKGIVTVDGTIRYIVYQYDDATDLNLDPPYDAEEVAVWNFLQDRLELLNPKLQSHTNHIGPDGIIGTSDDGSQLLLGSIAVDEGAMLARTVGAGSGTTMVVNNARYFSDGKGWIEGDLIQIAGTTNRARITAINYDTGQLTLDTSLTWADGVGITYAYEGAGPDIGAYERAANPTFIGYWRLDDGAGSLTALDDSGNDNHGTLTGVNAATAWIAGRKGLALHFDGDAYVEVPSDSSLNFGAGDNFTVLVWMRTTAPRVTAQYPMLLHKHDTSAPRSDWELFLSAAGETPTWYGKVRVADVAFQLDGTGILADGQWHRLGLIRQGTTLTLVEDGVAVDTVTNAALSADLSNTDPLRFGRTSFASPFEYFFTGDLDDIQLHTRAFSLSEIRTDYGTARRKNRGKGRAMGQIKGGQ